MQYDQRPKLLKFFKESDFIGKSVLEIGCGQGQFISAAKKLGAVKVCATELDPSLCEKARKEVPGLNVVCHDNNFPMSFFEDATFDIIMIPGVFCCIRNEKLLLAEVNRLLKKTGKVFIYDNSFAFPIHNFFRRKNPKYFLLYLFYVLRKFSFKPFRYCIYDVKDFLNISKILNLKIEKFEKNNVWGVPMNLFLVGQRITDS